MNEPYVSELGFKSFQRIPGTNDTSWVNTYESQISSGRAPAFISCTNPSHLRERKAFGRPTQLSS